METINVVEINGDDGIISSLRSWGNTNGEGEDSAKEHFRAICRETTDLNDEEIEQALDNGYAEVPGGASVQLVRSNNWAD